MSESNGAVEESLILYQTQLEQINAALSVASEDQKPDLLQLQKDLEEIIELTKHSINETDHTQTQGAIHGDEKHLENELDALEGVKCKVPFQYKWGGVGYHDAIILSSELSEEGLVLVRVVFMHPIMKKMQPCPYFLEGTCKYSDEKCHFSHGHQVKLDELRDYSEPDYNSIGEGSTVLAKYKDGLWYKGIVENVINGTQFSVKFLHCNDVQLLDFHSVYPLEEEGEEEESNDDSIDKCEDDSLFVPRVVDDSKRATATKKGFGDWEKHTKGIGSRLMEKMGYVPGSGLGKEGEGRLEPVQAMVFPPGRSLDRCMELREKVGDGDMLSVEKKLERQKAKAEQQLKQLAHAKKDLSLFDLINSKLAKETRENEAKGGTSREQPKMAELKQMSHKNLNVRSLQIGEEIKRTEKDIGKIKQSLERQRERGDFASVAQIRSRLAEREKDLDRLKASDQHIAREQNQRKSSSKLTIF